MGRAQIRGLVRLPAAHLGNEMRLRGSKIEVVSGPALFANGVRIARELVLDGGFETKGGIALDHADYGKPYRILPRLPAELLRAKAHTIRYSMPGTTKRRSASSMPGLTG